MVLRERTRKINPAWGLVFFCLCFFALLPVKVSAADDPAELKYCGVTTAKVDGEDVLTVEIGLSGDKIDYRVANKLYLPQQLVLQLNNTVPGRVPEETKLDGNLGERILTRQTELDSTKISLEMNFAVTEGSYKIYTLPADRKQKKPFRLMIELKKSAADESGLKGVAGKVIVLDAGHGGSDSGAVGPRGLKEKDASLAVTKKLQKILTNAGAKVVMTRETDRDVYGPNADDRQELSARVKVGQRARNAQIFLSIHCNAFSNAEAHGMETYHFPGSDRGKRLATLLNQELAAAGALFNRGVKQANFYVLRHSSMPASLVELAFITNPAEEKLLGDPAYQERLAQALAKGLDRYFLR